MRSMSETLPESLKKKISQRLRFYDDLGIRLFYTTRSGAPAADVGAGSASVESRGAGRGVAPAAANIPSPAARTVLPSPPIYASPSNTPGTAPSGARPPLYTPQTSVFAAPSAPKAPTLPVASGPSLFETVNKIEGDTLLKIREDIGDCKRCKLHKTRNKIVFADGNPKAELIFVGEGPGHDEDMQGLPFVGRAGKLLTQMIEAMGLQRKDVYICNVVKCRPPENRLPEKDEIAECSPFLLRQLDTVNPKVIVCLGACAAQTLLATNRGISHFRGQWLDFRGKKLMATYHPAYLLRNPNAKGEVWNDLKKVMAALGLQPRKKSAEAGI
jgi:uracil-DNA glycosylase